MSLEADDLLLFARVMEAGSFSRAAERLHLPKSTVSRRIAALEERLGEKLLQRSTRRLALTDFGQGVLEHARVVASEVDGALALALHRQQRPRGRLKVSMPGDFAQQALPDMLSRFVRDNPEVQLELDLSPRRVDLIAEGFDLAIRMGTLPEDSQLAARRLALIWEKLYASPGYLAEHGSPHTLDDLQVHRLISNAYYSEQGEEWRLEREDQQTTIKLRPALTVDQYSVVASILKQHHGIGLLPSYMGQPLVEKGILAEVLPDWRAAGWPVFLVFAYQQPLPRKYQAFMSFAIPRLQATLGHP